MPLIAGLLSGDQPTVTDMAGIGVALLAVVLVSRPAQDQGLGRGGLGLAVISGVGFGGYFLCMDQAASAGVETWWPIVASRSVAMAYGTRDESMRIEYAPERSPTSLSKRGGEATGSCRLQPQYSPPRCRPG
jgi:hypothetical protein